jgi:hypothetical protein
VHSNAYCRFCDELDNQASGREVRPDWLVLLSRLRATGMPVRDMLRYAGLARSGAGERERLMLLEGHRDRVRRALIEQQECLELLDTKIGIYRERLPAVGSDGEDSRA